MEPKDKQLVQDLDRLIAKFNDPQYPADLDNLKEAQDTIARSIFLKEFRENPHLKGVLKLITDDLGEMELALLNSESDKLPEVVRNSFVRMRKFYSRFVKFFFQDPDADLVDIRQWVGDQLKHLNDKGL